MGLVELIISIKKEYLSLLTPVSEAEYESLKQSIASKHGLIEPIIINKYGIVLDGHNRFRACKELGIPLQYNMKEFDNLLEEKQFVIEVNLTRRHLNEFQKAESGYLLEGVDADSLPLYQDLARFANKWLKVGGSLVTYVGNWAVSTVFDYMRSNNLQYWWSMCVEHTWGNARTHKQRVRVRWKPLLWFVKGPVNTYPTSMINDIHDFIESKPPEDNKLVHEWERSTAEASYIIENLSVEHQLVVDPFLGYGSTGVAAVQLGRRFIGSEIDQNYYRTAADRISRTRTTADDQSR